jgi:hypothetical protein
MVAPRGPSSRQSSAKNTPVRNGKATRGRPRIHAERWSKVSLVLFDRQIAYLDHLSATIRRKTGRSVNRTQIVRGLIDALVESRVNLTSVVSEHDVVGRLTERLRR